MSIENLTIKEARELAALFGGNQCKKRVEGDFSIVVLQRGWVAVGSFYQDGDDCRLEDAKVIRIWGTTKGLGQLALEGPQKDTKLDPAGTMRFHQYAIVSRIDTEKKKWN